MRAVVTYPFIASDAQRAVVSASTSDHPSQTPPSSPANPASGGPRLLDALVWRDAALIWLAQRVFLLAVAALSAGLNGAKLTPSLLLVIASRWDGAIYAGIAQSGYQHQWQSAFYPMLPGLEHLLAPLAGGDPYAAGLIIANVAALLALGLLRVLVERELGRAVARRTLLYLVAFPTAFFLFTAYTEALFLLFSVACFVALRRRHWLLAGCCAALAALTRPLGVLLIAPILTDYLLMRRALNTGTTQRDAQGGARLRLLAHSVRETLPALAACALPLLAVAGFVVALRSTIGATSPLQSELATGWGRDPTFPGMGYLRVAQALLTTSNAFQIAHIILDASFTTLLIALSIALWRRLPLAYVVYTWLSTAVILMTPSYGWQALASNMRFMLVLFPLFMLLGRWGQRPWVNALILVCSLTLLALLAAIFFNGGWVA